MQWIKKKRKKKNLCEWHEWYAWYPVKVEENSKQFRKVWLEWVLRRMVFTNCIHGTLTTRYYKPIGKEGEKTNV